MNLVAAATAYVRAGLCALPARIAQKRPTVPSWKIYQGRLPFQAEIDRWFAGADAVCLVCGAVSGNLEMLDFDLAGEAFEAWHQAVEAANAGLLARLVIEQSPSGGWHVIYRCESPINGNLKLAQKRQTVDGPDEVTIAGKAYRPRQDAAGVWHVVLTLIETRGEGGLFLCAPTPGYELFQCGFDKLPVLTEDERKLLLEAAWALNQCLPEIATPPVLASAGDGRPGDDFNERGDIRAVLQRHGWTLAQAGDNEYWRRPGKTCGWSATLKDNSFYVFSSSAAPFEQNQAYSPFSVYAMLEHGGDFEAAASALRGQGFGADQPPTPAADVDLSKLLDSVSVDVAPLPVKAKPTKREPIPERLLRVPGFVSEVMDFSMYAARYPNLELAFCGAMALQSFLCSRKVREEGGLRPNLYMLALADSGTGKAFPRKLNAHVLSKVGFGSALGNQISSGQGLEDEILRRRKMLYQTDEVDHLLRSLSSSKESYHSMLLSMLLQLYSEADQTHTKRTKVKTKGRSDDTPDEVDQPGLVIFGTATPECFFESLSTRLLTNGLFSRSIVIDVDERGQKQRTHDVSETPKSILEVAKWWKEYNPAPLHPETGQKPNLDEEHPTPAIVPFSEDGYAVLDAFAAEADEQYDAAKRAGDRVRAILWTRAYENATRLALNYACSRDHLTPCIDKEVASWAAEFMGFLVRRMLLTASQYVAENPFHADCLKLMRRLSECGGQMSRRDLMRLLHFKGNDFEQITSTLIQQGDIIQFNIPSKTKTALAYALT